MPISSKKMSNKNKICTLFVYIFLILFMRKYIQEVNKMAKETYTNKNIYDTVRKNIKKYRILANMTQQDLADASDLSHGYIRDIESIKMGITFSLDAVEKIAKALNRNVIMKRIFVVIVKDYLQVMVLNL